MPEYADVILLVKRQSLTQVDRRIGDPITIGREYNNDIRSRERIVSGNHGTIFYNDTLKYSDHSSNGTYLLRAGTTKHIRQTVIELQEKDVLTVGDLQIILAKVR